MLELNSWRILRNIQVWINSNLLTFFTFSKKKKWAIRVGTKETKELISKKKVLAYTHILKLGKFVLGKLDLTSSIFHSISAKLFCSSDCCFAWVCCKDMKKTPAGHLFIYQSNYLLIHSQKKNPDVGAFYRWHYAVWEGEG